LLALLLAPALSRAPTVRISGRNKTQARRARHVVRGTAADADGDLLRVEVRDQRPRGRPAFRPASGSSRWSYAALLKPGRNRINARAVDATGLRSGSARVTVVLRG